MAEAKLYGQNKGGMSINGIIKDYYAYAGEKISAGDLVEYVNGVADKTDYGVSNATQISTESKSGAKIAAIKLDSNRIFIAHQYGTRQQLYGIVVTVTGTAITYGPDTGLDTSDGSSGMAISVELLPNGNVFIAHSHDSARMRLAGTVVSINGTAITAGETTELSSRDDTGYDIETCLLPNGNVFVAYRYEVSSSTSFLYTQVVRVNGKTITKGTETKLSDVGYSGYKMPIVLLPNGNIFIAHTYGSNMYLYGIVCTISGTTITAGSDTVLSDTAHTGDRISTCLLPNGNVFIAHTYGSNYHLYGMVVSINGTTITKGTDTMLSNGTTYTGITISTGLLPNGNVFVAHNYNKTNYYLYGIVVSINGTTITKGTDTALENTNTYTGYAIATVVLDNGTIFIAHSKNSAYYLYAQIWGIDDANNIPTNQIIATEYETQIRQVTTGQFDGIAKTSGEGGDDTGHKDIIQMYTFPWEKSVQSLPPIKINNVISELPATLSLNGNSEQDGEPSPEHPSEIRSVKGKSENLVKLYTNTGSVTSAGVTVTMIDYNTVKINGTATANGWLELLYNFKNGTDAKTDVAIPLDNIKYTASCFVESGSLSSTDNAGYITFSMTDGSTETQSAVNFGKSKTFNGLKGIGRIFLAVKSGITYNNFVVKVQLNKGNKALPYQPYGYVPVEVKVEGKNLFDKDNAPVISGYTKSATMTIVSDTAYRMSYIKCKPNTTYTAQKISGYLFNLSYSDVEPAIGTSFTGRRSGGAGTKLSITTNDKAQYLIIEYYNNDANYQAILDSIQIEEGSTATPYEPYKGKTISLPLGDIELRSTPDGTRDTFERVDGVWNKKNEYGKVVLNGSETCEILDTAVSGVKRFLVKVANMNIVAINNWETPKALSNYFKLVSRDEMWQGINGMSVSTEDVRICSDAFNSMTINEFKSWLTTHNVDVIYPLATPTYTPITDQALISALDELEQLILHKGYNYITVTAVNDVMPLLELDYKAYRK